MAMYKFMRETYDNLWSPINEIIKIMENRELGKVANYVPMITDYNNNLTIMELFESNHKKIHVEKGFTKPVVPEAKQVIDVNSANIFLKHINDASYLITIGKTIRDIGRIVNDPKYKKMVGNKSSLHTQQWIDILARNG